MKTLRYIGRAKTLRGKTALVRSAKDGSDHCLAQFDNPKTGLGFGWAVFSKSDFRHLSARERRARAR